MALQDKKLRLPSGEEILAKRASGQERRRGMLEYQAAPDWTLILPRCPSVHMIGMSFPLDIVFLRGGRIIATHPFAQPGWRIYSAFAGVALEMPAGSIKQFQLRSGQRIDII